MKRVQMTADIAQMVEVFLYQGTNAGDVIVLASHFHRCQITPCDTRHSGSRQIDRVLVHCLDMFDEMAWLHLPGLHASGLKSRARDLFRVTVNLPEVVLELPCAFERTL